MNVSTIMQLVEELLYELRNVGVDIENNTAIHKILIELPAKFEIFCRSVQNEPWMPTLDILGIRFHLEENNMKLQSRNVTQEALVMKIQSMV